jgi:non-ribosomal peptide synthetase component F
LVTAHVSQGVATAFQAFSQASGVTLFISLLTVFKLLLYRQTGQEDIVVGTPTAVRNRTEFEKIIGFFLNNLALRTQFSKDDRFNDLLKRCAENGR